MSFVMSLCWVVPPRRYEVAVSPCPHAFIRSASSLYRSSFAVSLENVVRLVVMKSQFRLVVRLVAFALSSALSSLLSALSFALSFNLDVREYVRLVV